MDNEYVKILEKTIEDLKIKLNDCTIENEKLSSYCKSIEPYKPYVFEIPNGYLVKIKNVELAKIEPYTLGIGAEVTGFSLHVQGKLINTYETIEDALAFVEQWLVTGNDGSPIGY